MSPGEQDAVRAQYERWVYPQPIEDLSRNPFWDFGDPDFLGRAYWPDRKPREDLRILVAGCGPNAAARYAFHHPKASVVGVDLSEASLAHERRLQDKHGLANLELHRLRIEELQSLGRTFDFADASGVLHHLPDPAAGLKAIAACLAPDGVAYLMLYGKYGRAGIYMAQELYRILGLGQSAEDVAVVKASLAAFPADHLLRRSLAAANDTGFDAGLVDTFLHPLDRAYAIGDCLDLLASAGLVLQGWLNRQAYDVETRITHPALRERVARLPERGQLQALELLDGRIGTHSFYACRRERDPATWRTDFAGSAFLDLVPVPRPGWSRQGAGDLLLLLPAGLGTALTLRDRQAAVAAQIDGKRTVRACFLATGSAMESPQYAADFCRALFRQLWLAGCLDLVRGSAA